MTDLDLLISEVIEETMTNTVCKDQTKEVLREYSIARDEGHKLKMIAWDQK